MYFCYMIDCVKYQCFKQCMDYSFEFDKPSFFILNVLTQLLPRCRRHVFYKTNLNSYYSIIQVNLFTLNTPKCITELFISSVSYVILKPKYTFS